MSQLEGIKKRANQIEETAIPDPEYEMTVTAPGLAEDIEDIERQVQEKLNECEQEAENMEGYLEAVEKYKKAKWQMSGFLRKGTDHLFRTTQLPANKDKLQEALQKTNASIPKKADCANYASA